MAAPRRRSTSHRRRRRSHRRRRNLYVAAPRRNPRRRHHRRRYRRNPILPTKIFSQALFLGAGYLAAPMLSNMIPWTPTSKLGQYAKTAIVTTLGSQLAGKALGKKYGNALLAGGWLWIAVDALKSGTTLFGGTGMGFYYPDDAALAAGWEGAGIPPVADIPGASLAAGRLAPRFH